MDDDTKPAAAENRRRGKTDTPTDDDNRRMNGEFLLPAAFLAGFFGGTHCIGMCGAIVVLFEQQPLAGSGHWARRLAYNGWTARLLCVLLGAVAGAQAAPC